MPRFIPDASVIVPRPTDAAPATVEHDFGSPAPVENTTSVTDAIEAGWVEGNFTTQQLAPVVESTQRDITGQGPDPIMAKWLRQLDTPVSPIDPNYRPDFDSLKGTKYERYADRFVGVNSQDEFDTVKSEIDMFDTYNAAFNEHPVAAWSTMIAASVLDPVNLIPLVNVAAKQSIGTKIAYTAASFGALNVGMTQAERDRNPNITAADVVFAGTVGAIAGAAVGGVVGKVQMNAIHEEVAQRLSGIRTTPEGKTMQRDSKGVWHFTNETNKEVTQKLSNVKITSDGREMRQDANGVWHFVDNTDGKSAGAAEVETLKVRSLDPFVVKTIKASTLTKYTRGATLNAAMSPLPTVRDLANNMFGHAMRLIGEPDDFPSIYSKVQRQRGEDAAYLSEVKQDYLLYAKRVPKEKRLTPEQFDTEAFITYTRRQREPDYKSPISEVNSYVDRTAPRLRTRKDEMIASKLFSDHFDELKAAYYVPRMWIRKEVDALTGDRIERIAAEQFARSPKRFKGPEDAVVTLQNHINKISDGGNIDDIKTAADVLDGEGAFTSSTSVGTSKNAKATFTRGKEKFFDDDLLAKHGLIETNLQAVTNLYMMKTRQLMEMRRFLDRHNVATIPDLIKKMKQDMSQELFAAKESGMSKDKVAKLRSDLEFDIGQGEALIKELFGTIKPKSALDPYISTLRTYTSSVMLPNVVLSQLQDNANAIVRNGLETSLKTPTEAFAKGVTSLKITAKDNLKVGVCLDFAINDTLVLLSTGNYSDNMLGATRLDKFNTAASKAFGKFSGISPTTAFQKNFYSVGIGDSMASTIKDWSNKAGDPAKIQRLKDLGIGQQHVKPILEQIKKHAKSKDGLTYLNVPEWDEGLAKDKMIDALIREVDHTVITPNQGDTPTIFLTSVWGQLIGQFRSYNAAAQSKILATNLQDKNAAHILKAMFVLMAGGYMRYSMGELLQGREPDTSIETVALQGLTRSGFIPLTYDILIQNSPIKNSTRYAESTFIGTVLGPSASMVEKMVELGLAPADPYEDKYTMAARATELIPLLNIMYLATNLKKVFKEESRNDPESRRQRREARKESKRKQLERKKREF